MVPIDDRDFVEEIAQLAGELQLTMALRDAHFASARRAGTTGESREEMAIKNAEQLLTREDVRQRLSPVLAFVTEDLREVAKVVAKALMPLTLGPTPVISPTPLAFAALTALILRSERENRHRSSNLE
jgi:hypothetical protein